MFEALTKKSFWTSLFASATGSGRFRFTFEELRNLYDVLNRNQTVTEANKALVVETIRSIAEFIIWGDQNEPKIFEFFLEHNVMLYLHRLLLQPTNRSGDVAKQVLQTLSIIIQNVRSETGTYFLFSNNHINNIIEIRFDFDDEEVLGYYISFLKTISLKLNAKTVQFFFSSDENDGVTFPLYSEAIKFAHHKEGMVRAGVRTLTLNVYTVDDPYVREFITSSSSINYLDDVAAYLVEQVKVLDQHLISAQGYSPQLLSSLDSQIAEVEDIISYVSDVLSTACAGLARLLAEKIWSTVVGPYLFGPLLELCSYSMQADDPLSAGLQPLQCSTVNAACSLYVLERLVHLLTYKPLLHNLLLALFGVVALPPLLPSGANSTGAAVPAAAGAAADDDMALSDAGAQLPSMRPALQELLRSQHRTAVPALLRLIVAVVQNKAVDSEVLLATGLVPRSRIRDLHSHCRSSGPTGGSGCSACQLHASLCAAVFSGETDGDDAGSEGLSAAQSLAPIAGAPGTETTDLLQLNDESGSGRGSIEQQQEQEGEETDVSSSREPHAVADGEIPATQDMQGDGSGATGVSGRQQACVATTYGFAFRYHRFFASRFEAQLAAEKARAAAEAAALRAAEAAAAAADAVAAAAATAAAAAPSPPALHVPERSAPSATSSTAPSSARAGPRPAQPSAPVVQPGASALPPAAAAAGEPLPAADSPAPAIEADLLGLDELVTPPAPAASSSVPASPMHAATMEPFDAVSAATASASAATMSDHAGSYDSDEVVVARLVQGAFKRVLVANGVELPEEPAVATALAPQASTPAVADLLDPLSALAGPSAPAPPATLPQAPLQQHADAHLTSDPLQALLTTQPDEQQHEAASGRDAGPGGAGAGVSADPFEGGAPTTTREDDANDAASSTRDGTQTPLDYTSAPTPAGMATPPRPPGSAPACEGPPCALHAGRTAALQCSNDLLDLLVPLMMMPLLPVSGLWHTGFLLSQLLPRADEQAGSDHHMPAEAAEGQRAAATAAATATVAAAAASMEAAAAAAASTAMPSAAEPSSAAAAAADPLANPVAGLLMDADADGGNGDGEVQEGEAGHSQQQQQAAMSSSAAQPAAQPPAQPVSSAPQPAPLPAQQWCCMLTSEQREAFGQAWSRAASALLSEVGGIWCDALLPLMLMEWPQAYDATLRPMLRPSAEVLVAGPHLYPQPPAPGTAADARASRNEQGLARSAVAALHAYHAVQRLVALAHTAALLRLGSSRRDAPLPPKPDSSSPVKPIEAVEGMPLQLEDGSALGCIVSFQPGKEQRVFFGAHGSLLSTADEYVANPAALLSDFAGALTVLAHSQPSVVLMEASTTRLYQGIVMAIAPLIGCEVDQDRQVPKWLHVHVRPSVRGLLRVLRTTTGRKGGLLAALRQLADGHWVLAFSDSDRSGAAKAMVAGGVHKLRTMYMEVLAQLVASPLD